MSKVLETSDVRHIRDVVEMLRTLPILSDNTITISEVERKQKKTVNETQRRSNFSRYSVSFF